MTGRSRAGPGAYNIPSAFDKPRGGTSWGASRGPRSELGGGNKGTAPGPGAYNPTPAANGHGTPVLCHGVIVVASTSSSAFASTAPRVAEPPHGKGPGPRAYPGPGAYKPEASTNLAGTGRPATSPQNRSTAPRNARAPELQRFQSLTPRTQMPGLANPAARPTWLTTPGPGAYCDSPTTTTAHVCVRSPSRQHSVSPMGATAAVPFSASSERWPGAAETPGPAAYRPEDSANISNDVYDKALRASRTAAFGGSPTPTAGGRSPSPQRAGAHTPGPAHYDPPPPRAHPSEPHHHGQSAGFAPQLHKQVPSIGPGAGSYELDAPGMGMCTTVGSGQYQKGHRVSPFHSDTDRFAVHDRAVPGPGAYKQVDVQLTKPRVAAPLLKGTERGDCRHVDYFPSPAEYDVGVYDVGALKKSHNVTYS
ncbi:hypothetical protein FOA52_012342 [Chlamydomonas sp. UWO 241]|nr:hypothetical protein FOA52_012342 [Chlamydomonas sp. UWO 241]